VVGASNGYRCSAIPTMRNAWLRRIYRRDRQAG
jgi:hypothetical protein